MSDNAIVAVADVGREQIYQLAEAASQYAQAGMAESTRRSYGSSWRDFTSWCASVGACALPAEATTVALYLTARAPNLAVSTLARHVSAIAAAHAAAGLPPPAHPDLSRVWAGIKRSHGRPARKKRGLVVADLRKVLRKIPQDLRGQRDRAILLVGFAGAFRRGELAKLSLPGASDRRAPIAQFLSEGLEIQFAQTKGDQEGRGGVVAVPFGKEICAVAALEAWIRAAGITAGPIFRAVDRHGRVGAAAISDKAVADVVKARCQAAGFDPAAFAGHSLRRGLITSAARAGAAPDVLQSHARHARFDTTRAYIEEGDRFRRNAVGKVGL